MSKCKLFRVTVKGVVNSTLPRNCSPGITYVVASSIDKAYNAVLLMYATDKSLGNLQDFELNTIDVVAAENTSCNCANSYKLIMADTSYDQLASKLRIDINSDANSTVDTQNNAITEQTNEENSDLDDEIDSTDNEDNEDNADSE